MSVIELTKDDFVDWSNNPVTIVVFDELQRRKQEYLVNSVKLALNETSVDAVALAVAKTAGSILALEDILDTDWKDELLTEEDNGN